MKNEMNYDFCVNCELNEKCNLMDDIGCELVCAKIETCKVKPVRKYEADIWDRNYGSWKKIIKSGFEHQAYNQVCNRICYLSCFKDEYICLYTKIFESIKNNITENLSILSIGCGAGIDYLSAQNVWGEGNFGWQGIDMDDWGKQKEVSIGDKFIKADGFTYDYSQLQDKNINLVIFPHSCGGDMLYESKDNDKFANMISTISKILVNNGLIIFVDNDSNGAFKNKSVLNGLEERIQYDNLKIVVSEKSLNFCGQIRPCEHKSCYPERRFLLIYQKIENARIGNDN